MTAIAYAETGTHHAAEIHADGRYVGLLFKETKYVGPRPFYVVLLNDDPRGAKIVRNRSLLSEIVADRVASHPSLSPDDGAALSPAMPGVPF